MKIELKRLLLFGLSFLLIFVICAVIGNRTGSKNKQQIKDLSYSEFIVVVEKGLIKEVSINGPEISGLMNISEKETVKFKTRGPDKSDAYLPLLKEKGIKVVFAKPSSCGTLGFLLPWIIIIIIYILIFRRMGAGGAGSAFNFARSKAKMFLDKNENPVRFADVGGMPEVKEELKEVVIDLLRNPRKFAQLGAKIPKGVLLVGAPGTGKTLLARAAAGEAGVPFFSVSGSEFVEMFVGVGAARVRDLFNQAKRRAPCIIFIDELDALGAARGLGVSRNDEREQTVNQLLTEMDGFEPAIGIIILAATNRPDMLDPGLMRPGRFSRQIHLPLPDVEGRTAILKIHTKNMPLADDANLTEIAQMYPGASGADLSNIANEAAILAARREKDKVSKNDFADAGDKVLMGLERKIIMSEKERRTAAIHEVGHAFVIYFLLGPNKLDKVSIIARGMALGITKQRSEEEHFLYTASELKAEIAVLLGGRAAEEIILKDVSTGAANDLMRANEIVRKMILELGMIDGLLGVYSQRHKTFLGDYAEKENYSEETAKKIDRAKEKLLADCYKQAEDILTRNVEKLNKVIELLLKKETITKEDFESCL